MGPEVVPGHGVDRRQTVDETHADVETVAVGMTGLVGLKMT